MPASPANWLPLKLLAQRFTANVSAIAGRDPQLAAELRAVSPPSEYYIRTENNRVVLGQGHRTAIEAVPPVMLPVSAQATQAKLFPEGNYNQPVLVVGEDLGWLVNSLYQMTCVIPSAPGHRPPVFFLMRDLERLWVILHIQDWEALLADTRVRLYAGMNCVESFRRSLVEQVMCRWPTLSVAIDPTVWPAGVTLESCYIEARAKQNAELARLQARIEVMHTDLTPSELAELFQSRRPLRVLGITSRYTTFIQYSLRDWLEAFGRLGHETRVLIETADHELPNNLAVAGACAEFAPDLIVSIDHYRPELSGVPAKIPVVMWVQDRMPNIFCPEAGQRQTRLDYTIGYSCLELTQQNGYHVSRFMPAMMAVNEKRFSPRHLTPGERDQYGCDVSFVTNCTAPAEKIVRESAEQVGSPIATKLMNAVFEQLQAIYKAGGSVTSGDVMRSMIVKTAEDQRIRADIDGVLDLFVQRVNNSLFRHQAIRWVAETGVNLHLYGKGWEDHPEFRKYARGVADNQAMLPTIYQASAINLQVTPFGAVHQRLLDGLAAGGFFLLRGTTADDLELILRDMDTWCRERAIRSGSEMFARQDATLQALARRYCELGGTDPLSKPDYYFGAVRECAQSGYTRTANTLWDDSDRVTFCTRDRLQTQVRHFLQRPDERRAIAGSMRQRVLETHTYYSITRRMLDFIAGDLREFRPLSREPLAA